jgi:hypothetical protein
MGWFSYRADGGCPDLVSQATNPYWMIQQKYWRRALLGICPGTALLRYPY